MCRSKENFFLEFERLMVESAKDEVTADSTVVMGILAEASRNLLATPCTPRTSGFWSKLTEFVKKARETNDYYLKKVYAEKIRDGVLALVSSEKEWNAKGNAVLLLSAVISVLAKPLTPISYVPWASLLVYQLSPVAALLLLASSGLAALALKPTLGLLFLISAVGGYLERKVELDLSVPKVARRVSREEVERLFVQYYGERLGRELFRFELYQLILSGRTVEEALSELWERLTNTQISSRGYGRLGGERVSAGRREDQGAENNN